MFSEIYLNTCAQVWTFLAQTASPVTGAASAATPAAVAASPAAVATAVPASASTAIPTALATAIPAAASTAIPALPGNPVVISTAAPAQLQHAINQAATQAASDSMPFAIFHGLLLAVYFVICAGLILCVMFHTTKNEGLSGVMGGTATSSLFRGKKSAEEHLGLWTTRLAVAFILISLTLWFMGK